MNNCRKILYILLFVAPIALFSANSPVKGLTNEEIDTLFISFEQEARKNAEERRKREIEEKKMKEQNKLLSRERGRSTSGSRVALPHNGGYSVSNTKSMSGLMPPPPSSKGKSRVAIPFSISGILCSKKKCEAIIGDKTFKVGDHISATEKITKITKTKVVTNLRKIIF